MPRLLRISGGASLSCHGHIWAIASRVPAVMIMLSLLGMVLLTLEMTSSAAESVFGQGVPQAAVALAF